MEALYVPRIALQTRDLLFLQKLHCFMLGCMSKNSWPSRAEGKGLPKLPFIVGKALNSICQDRGDLTASSSRRERPLELELILYPLLLETSKISSIFSCFRFRHWPTEDKKPLEEKKQDPQLFVLVKAFLSLGASIGCCTLLNALKDASHVHKACWAQSFRINKFRWSDLSESLTGLPSSSPSTVEN